MGNEVSRPVGTSHVTKEQQVATPLGAQLEDLRSDHVLPAIGLATFRMRSGDDTADTGGIDGSNEAAPVLDVEIACVGERVKGIEFCLVGAEDRFHLGSNGKAMTSSLVSILLRNGKLAPHTWETPMHELLPSQRMHDDWKDVTLRHLLSHTSGAARSFLSLVWMQCWAHTGNNIASQRSRASIVPQLLHRPTANRGPLPRPYLYSNAGYTCVGFIIEVVCGESFESLLQRYLFQPLGMSSAGFGMPCTSKSTITAPLGHGNAGRSPVWPGSKADNPGTISPAGCMHASLLDYARFCALQLSGGRVVRTRCGGVRLGQPCAVPAAAGDILPMRERTAGGAGAGVGAGADGSKCEEATNDCLDNDVAESLIPAGSERVGAALIHPDDIASMQQAWTTTTATSETAASAAVASSDSTSNSNGDSSSVPSDSDSASVSGYSAGWKLVKRIWASPRSVSSVGEPAKGLAMTHTGSNTSNYCTVWLAPEVGIGVIACTNAAGGDVPNVINTACTLGLKHLGVLREKPSSYELREIAAAAPI